MPRTYTFGFSSVTVSAAEELLAVQVAGTKHARLSRLWVSASGVDLAEQLLPVQWRRVSSVPGTNTTPEPVQRNQGATNLNTFARRNGAITTPSTIYWERIWDVRYPFEWVPSPELRPQLDRLGLYSLALATAPAAPLVISANWWWEELG